MFAVRPLTGTVNTPVPPAPCGALFGYGPPDAVPHSTPRAVTVAPPSAVTLPPRIAVVSVTAANVGEVTVGGEAGVVVEKVPCVENDVPAVLVAHARKKIVVDAVRAVTGTVNMPVPPAPAGTLFAYGPPGIIPHSTPRAVTVAPPSQSPMHVSSIIAEGVIITPELTATPRVMVSRKFPQAPTTL